MKVKIINCSNPDYWYYNLIGKIIEVEKTTGLYNSIKYEYDGTGKEYSGCTTFYPEEIEEINGKDTNRIEETTKAETKIFTDILKKYIDKAEIMNSYLELENIATAMICELRNKSMFSVIYGQKYDVIEIAKELKDNDPECKDIILDDDRLSWITRGVSNKFDFDEFEKSVKEEMIYTQENYEK